MLFQTLSFFAFLAVVLALFYLLPKRVRTLLLLAASYYFYLSWNPRFVWLLLSLTAIDYAAGRWIATRQGWSRKAALTASVAANLGFLGFFKYYNFGASELARLLHLDPNLWHLDIILPLGISFHTFQSISYVVDVYRGRQEPIRNFVDYAVFLAFFPQLVAGPIVRASDFFRDLYDWRAPSLAEVQRGIFLVLVGLVKKMVLADTFAIAADAYFTHAAAQPGRLTAWTGTIAFAMQIFFDFSGYTDIAIGVAKLFGFHFPVNFARPYLATSITMFWRRWHISLSTWLREYLYIPLGGNRRGVWQTYRNLLLTMLLGGLWHGASWNFMIWGGYHGLLLAVERAIGGKRLAEERWSPWQMPRMLLTFALVLVGWVFFRATGLTEALTVFRQMILGPTWGPSMLDERHWTMIVIAAALAWIEETTSMLDRIASGPLWARAATTVVLLFTLELFGQIERAVPFVYFQF